MIRRDCYTPRHSECRRGRPGSRLHILRPREPGPTTIDGSAGTVRSRAFRWRMPARETARVLSRSALVHYFVALWMRLRSPCIRERRAWLAVEGELREYRIHCVAGNLYRDRFRRRPIHVRQNFHFGWRESRRNRLTGSVGIAVHHHIPDSRQEAGGGRTVRGIVGANRSISRAPAHGGLKIVINEKGVSELKGTGE